MADKTIETGLCPGGRLRMEQLLRVLEGKRVDPTLMTTHTFPFAEIERAFEVSDKKLDDVIKPLITFLTHVRASAGPSDPAGYSCSGTRSQAQASSTGVTTRQLSSASSPRMDSAAF
jgi:hypothetical protein